MCIFQTDFLQKDLINATNIALQNVNRLNLSINHI